MRRLSLALVIFLGAGVWLHQPLRRACLAVFRLPLTTAERALDILLDLPQVPRLEIELARLRTELTQRQLDIVRLQEALRHQTRATALRQTAGGRNPAGSDTPLGSEGLRFGRNPAGSDTPLGSEGLRFGASGLVARVIGRTIIPTEHVILLDRGLREGVVREGVLVDVAGVVGRIVEVHPTTSLVSLLTDPDSRIACLVERSREGALLVGTGGLQGRLEYLDLEADVEAGDRVVTAGLGGSFPSGLLLGVVTKVQRDERNARVIAWVRPSVRPNQLEEVLCLPPATSNGKTEKLKN